MTTNSTHEQRESYDGESGLSKTNSLEGVNKDSSGASFSTDPAYNPIGFISDPIHSRRMQWILCRSSAYRGDGDTGEPVCGHWGDAADDSHWNL